MKSSSKSRYFTRLAGRRSIEVIVKKIQFQRLPKSLLATTKPHRLFTDVADHLGRQFEGPRGIEPDRIESAPFSAQVIYWLWRFSCEAGICGMDVFLQNHVGIYAPQIYESLEVIGASELMARIEAAVPLARDGHPDFGTLTDQSWYEQFPPVAEFPSWKSINHGVYALIRAISKPTGQFIRENADKLFTPK